MTQYADDAPVSVRDPSVKFVDTVAGMYVLRSVFTWRYGVSSVDVTANHGLFVELLW